MTKLKKGTLYFSYDDIRKFMNLSEDTHLHAERSHDGIEVHVVANEANTHDWLIDAKSSNWNIARVKVELNHPPLSEADVFNINITLNADAKDASSVAEEMIKKLKAKGIK